MRNIEDELAAPLRCGWDSLGQISQWMLCPLMQFMHMAGQSSRAQIDARRSKRPCLDWWPCDGR